MVLGILLELLQFSITGLSPSLASLSRLFSNHIGLMLKSHNPSFKLMNKVWAVTRSLATTRVISELISFPEGTEMFHFPSFALCHYVFMTKYHKMVSFLIQKSSDHSVCATPRSLSQLTTSFIASWCQGIHRKLLVA